VSSKVDNQLVQTKINVIKDRSNVSVDDVVYAASTVKVYYEKNHKLPKTVYLSGQSLNTAQFLNIIVKATVNIKNYKFSSITIKKVRSASSPSRYYSSGRLYKSEYNKTAINIKNYINTEGQAPNYSSTSLGNINFNKLVYLYSKILNYYNNNKKLPSYVWVP